jgi:hypothetical protein
MLIDDFYLDDFPKSGAQRWEISEEKNGAAERAAAPGDHTAT